MSNEGLHCPLTESANRMYEWRAKAWINSVHEQDDLNLHILCMLKGNFSLDLAIIISDIEDSVSGH